MFESSHTSNPDDISTRYAQKLTKMNSSQVTHVIHNMFDGITHNTHNTNGSIGRMRKDFPGGNPVDQIGQSSPQGMVENSMCNGGPGSGQYPPQPPPPHNNAGPQLTDMNCLPHGVVGGMMGGMDGHYGNSFQLSANVQAEAAEMNEEERRRRFALGNGGDGRMPPMGNFDPNMVAKMPYCHESGTTKSSAEEDEEDEDDYDEEFEEVRAMDERQTGKPVTKRRKMQFNCFQCPKRYFIKQNKKLNSIFKNVFLFPATEAENHYWPIIKSIPVSVVIVALNAVSHWMKKLRTTHNTTLRNFLSFAKSVVNPSDVIYSLRIIIVPCMVGINVSFRVSFICPFQYERFLSFTGHTCPECSESFPTLVEYRKHLADKNHTDNPAICDICGDRFNGLPLLKKHVLKMHKQG